MRSTLISVISKNIYLLRLLTYCSVRSDNCCEIANSKVLFRLFLHFKLSLSSLLCVSVDVFLQGGIKAVVWTDTFQMLVIFTGFIVVIVSGTITVGGWGVIWAKAFEGKRFTNDIE